MPPNYSQMEAWAAQQGLGDEYTKKLASLMGVQAPQPQPQREVIDLDQWQSAQNARTIDLDAPPVIDLDAPAPREVIDMDAWQQSQNARAIDLDAPPVIDLDAPRQPTSVSFDRKPTSFSRERPVIDLDAPQSGGRQPTSISTGISQQDIDRAQLEEVQGMSHPTQQQQAPLDLRGGGGGGVSASSLKQLEALGGMAAGTQQDVDKAFKDYGEAEANQMAPIAAANQNVSDVYGDVGAVKGYEAQVIQQRQKQFESKFKEVNVATKQAQDKLMGMDPLDPNRAWKQADVGGKLAIALSYIGAAFAMNYGNDPHAAQRTTEAIFGRDLEKQKLEYEKQRENVDVSKNQYAALMAQYKDETAAQAAYFEPIYESLANKISQHVASGKAGQASAQMDAIGKQFALKATEMKDLRTQSALQQAKIAAVRGASAGGSSAGEAAVLLDDKEQTKLQNELVRTSEGSFLLSSAGDEQIKEARKVTSVANNFITDANAALSLANSVGSAAEGLGPGWLNQARFVKLKGALTALGIQYGKTNEMGAYDAGLQEAVNKILGNPNSSITDVRNLIAQSIERSRSKTRVYISQNKNFRHANIVPYKKKGYLGVTQEGIVPGAYVTSQDPNLPTPVEKP